MKTTIFAIFIVSLFFVACEREDETIQKTSTLTVNDQNSSPFLHAYQFHGLVDDSDDDQMYAYTLNFTEDALKITDSIESQGNALMLVVVSSNKELLETEYFYAPSDTLESLGHYDDSDNFIFDKSVFIMGALKMEDTEMPITGGIFTIERDDASYAINFELQLENDTWVKGNYYGKVESYQYDELPNDSIY